MLGGMGISAPSLMPMNRVHDIEKLFSFDVSSLLMILPLKMLGGGIWSVIACLPREIFIPWLKCSLTNLDLENL